MNRWTSIVVAIAMAIASVSSLIYSIEAVVEGDYKGWAVGYAAACGGMEAAFHYIDKATYRGL